MLLRGKPKKDLSIFHHVYISSRLIQPGFLSWGRKNCEGEKWEIQELQQYSCILIFPMQQPQKQEIYSATHFFLIPQSSILSATEKVPSLQTKNTVNQLPDETCNHNPLHCKNSSINNAILSLSFSLLLSFPEKTQTPQIYCVPIDVTHSLFCNSNDSKWIIQLVFFHYMLLAFEAVLAIDIPWR